MFLFAQEGGAAAAAPGPGNFIGMLVPFILIFVIFYFVIILPAKKKQKSHQSLIDNLQGGERVVTTGGIYGTVSRVLEDRFELEVDKGTRLQVAKSSVSAVITPEGAEPKAK